MSPVQSRHSGNPAGLIITIGLVLGLLSLGLWLIFRDSGESPADATTVSDTTSGTRGDTPAFNDGEAPEPIEPVTGSPQLDRAAAYQPKDGIIDVDISEYAGYAGLIVANGGLAPNPDSIFARKYGFQVRLSLSEEEGWSKLNNGRIAASVTTADVLAVLGRQFEVAVPAQIAFSRGADQVVVDAGIANINALKGKVLAASQFNESEFFIRYLASEAGVPVKVLRDLDARPAAGELGLVFYEDAFVACDAYDHELRGANRLNGCVGWSPRTEKVVETSGGRAKSLVSNRNLLIIADLLLVNKGFATAHPEWVLGLTHGLMEGNAQLRDKPEAQLALIARSFGWTEQETRDEMAKVHYSNLPENRAFFRGTIDAAGSFQGIFQSSVLAYGSVIRNAADPARFVDASHLDKLAADGLFAGQQIAIAPIRSGSGQVSLEGDALLSKDVRFFFEVNSAVLDRNAEQNDGYLDTIKNFLQVSPGSVVMLRGHVDNARIAEFERQGGQALVRTMALHAMELSRQRAKAVRDALLKRYPNIDPQRVELVGRGWEEPAGPDSDLNRRVEVQWFTLE